MAQPPPRNSSPPQLRVLPAPRDQLSDDYDDYPTRPVSPSELGIHLHTPPRQLPRYPSLLDATELDFTVPPNPAAAFEALAAQRARPTSAPAPGASSGPSSGSGRHRSRHSAASVPVSWFAAALTAASSAVTWIALPHLAPVVEQSHAELLDLVWSEPWSDPTIADGLDTIADEQLTASQILALDRTERAQRLADFKQDLARMRLSEQSDAQVLDALVENAKDQDLAPTALRMMAGLPKLQARRAIQHVADSETHPPMIRRLAARLLGSSDLRE